MLIRQKGPAFALLALVVLALAGLASPTPPQKTAQEKQTNYTAIQKSTNIIGPETADNLIAQYTFWLTVFTAVLAISTIGLWFDTGRSGRRELKHTQVIERAYVAISHAPPGITWFDDTGAFHLEFTVKNNGNTPADVTDILIRPTILKAGTQLPGVPNYMRQRSQNSFHVSLVKNAEITYHNPELMRVSPRSQIEIAEGTETLFIFGYIDYIDKFRVRHRSGYARVYNPDAPEGGPNLLFVSERGYNYDRPRKRGEGNDWD